MAQKCKVAKRPVEGMLGRPQPEGLNARRDGIARQKARAARAAELLAFRQEQAFAAKEYVDDLNGLARKVADLLIDAFPEAVVSETIKRTSAAEHKMLARLTNEEKRRTVAVNLGVSRARVALLKAYDRVVRFDQEQTEPWPDQFVNYPS